MNIGRMRAIRCVCWLLAGIYLFAALGSAVASGDELPVQLAVSLPAVLVAGPAGVGRATECVADAVVDAVIGERESREDHAAKCTIVGPTRLGNGRTCHAQECRGQEW